MIKRRIGFPVVHCDADFTTPLRFGDAMDIDPRVESLGRSTVTFRSTARRVHDDIASAIVRHTCDDRSRRDEIGRAAGDT